MKALVTGASGFIGSQLVRLCRERGLETYAAVRPGSSTTRIAGVDGVSVLRADLADVEAMRRVALECRPDLAIHLAWHIDADVHEAPENLVCAIGSLALLRGLDEAGCRRVVFAGTHLEYAPSDDDLAESAALAPASFYATAKHATRELAEAYSRSRAISFAWARIFNVYGPGDASFQLVPTILDRLCRGAPCELGDGDDVRAFLHVEDAAAALLAIALSDVEGSVNVGSDEAVTLRTLATELARRVGGAERLCFGANPRTVRDRARVVADVGRLRDRVGFRPRHTLARGLDATVQAFLDERAREVST